MGNPKTTIGLRFLCLEDLIFGSDEVMYRGGKIYKSEVEGCITNEKGCKEHLWFDEDNDNLWKVWFRIIGNKRRSGRR